MKNLISRISGASLVLGLLSIGATMLFPKQASGQMTPGYIYTYAGNGTAGSTGDGGLATSAELNRPHSVSFDSAGNAYIADFAANQIRKVTLSTGDISTVAGNGTGGYSGDGGAATSAELNEPESVVVDASGNIYIADSANFVVRKVDHSTGYISTVAGNGTSGFSGDGGAATSAEFNRPYGLAVDTSGNIYISDNGNNRVRKLTVSTGVVDTVAGGGSSGLGDGGPATNAQLSAPQGLAFDGSGNLYIADFGHYRIREVNASTSDISTVAGDGVQGNTGDGSSATLAEINALGVVVDHYGNIFISSAAYIRKVTVSTGIISTVAGTGVNGYNGDNILATTAEIGDTDDDGLAIYAGSVFLADSNNSRVRELYKIVDPVYYVDSSGGPCPTVATPSFGFIYADGENGGFAGAESESVNASIQQTVTCTWTFPSITLSYDATLHFYGSFQFDLTFYASDTGSITGGISGGAVTGTTAQNATDQYYTVTIPAGTNLSTVFVKATARSARSTHTFPLAFVMIDVGGMYIQ